MADTENSAIAVVGLGCRVPGADGPEALWELLDGLRDEISRVPESREVLHGAVTSEGSAGADGPASAGAEWGGFLEDLASWDPHFFGISQTEAAVMDPQQALALEVSWRALEYAGITQADLLGSRTGVFFGQATHDHAMLLGGADPRAAQGPYTNPGLSHAITANRLSYLWDLRGPSLTVDTACSSSLVAVHLAARSLRSGECDMAIAGGVNALLSPVPQLGAAGLTALAADGRCRTFDASGQGYVRAEGGGAVVLRRLEDAVAAGDRVHAVIRGSGVNQDGRTNGLTAPSGRSQTELIVDSLRRAGVASGEELGYVELHGTGTPLGDPIEARALSAALNRVLGEERPPLPVGSVKANIGHLEAAAGVLGLIKTALVLRHGVVPGNPHLREVNPRIDLEGSGLRMSATRTELPKEISAAAVSSFGFGGTNASVVLARAPRRTPRVRSGARAGSLPVLLPLSARAPESLAAYARAWAEKVRVLESWDEVRQLARAAVTHRTLFEWRTGVVAHDKEELLRRLEEIAEGRRRPTRASRGAGSLGFVYSGHGSQWEGMGRELLRSCPAFAARVREADAVLAPMLGWSPLAALEQAAPVELDDIRVAQPLIFTVQLALTAQLADLGIEPDAVVGHSMGELSAAVVAGRLGLETACRVLRARNDAVEAARGTGGMAVVEASADETAEILRGLGTSVTVAADNSPRSCVVSGSSEALSSVLAEFERLGREARRVKVDYPSHGPLMEAPAEELGRLLGHLEAGKRRQGPAFYSSVHGRPYDDELDSRYWQDNLTHPVRVREAVSAMAGNGVTHLLEISPHPVLLVALRECLEAFGEGTVALHTGHRDTRESAQLREVEAALFEHAFWHGTEPDETTRGWAEHLPVHPFLRTRVYEPPAQAQARAEEARPRLTEASFQPGTFLAGLPLREQGKSHTVAGEPAVSATEMAATALWAARRAGLDGANVVRDLELIRRLPAEDGVERQLVLHRSGDGSRPARSAAVSFHFGRAGQWVRAASCTVDGQPPPPPTAPATAERKLSRPPGTSRTLADVLDEALPAVAEALLAGRPDATELDRFAVSGIGALHVAADPGTADAVVAEGRLRESQGNPLMDITLVSTTGTMLVHVQRLALTRLAESGAHPVVDEESASADRSATGGALARRLLSTASEGERYRELSAWLRAALEDVLPNRLHTAAEPDEVPFVDMGLDSLMGVELRNRLEKELGLRMSATLVWAHPTIRALASALLRRLGPAADPSPSSGQGASPEASAEGPDGPSRAEGSALQQLLAELDGSPPGGNHGQHH
ncbi:hypothetical protein GCM10009801_19040 [Streptomyces albiaxialis]|uniref:Carrier domain-containing protein n=1 Tax=Streptomyces albiaxialis TaxID=329523 RepID=A0ABP5HBZ8_9ACTN